MSKQERSTEAAAKENSHGPDTSNDTDGGQDSTSRQKSMNLDEPTKDSNKRWRKPDTVRQFASQVNEVATLLLNGDIDPKMASTFSALARVISQTVSTEVTRARFVKEEPNMKFDEDVFEDQEGGE